MAEFTRHVSRSKVISAGSVAVPLVDNCLAGEVAHDDLIHDIADQVEASNTPFKVMREGEAIGQIDRKSIVDVLIGRH